MDLGDISRLISYVLPGFVAVELKNFLTATRRRSDFERLAESILLSLIGYALTWVIAWVLMTQGRLGQVDPTRMSFIIGIWFVAIMAGLTWATILRSPKFVQLAEVFAVQYTPEPSYWAELLRFPRRNKVTGLVLERVYKVDERGLLLGDPLDLRVYIPATRIVSFHVLPLPSSSSSTATV